LIKPEQGAEFIANLAIGKFHGIGPATESKMNKLGIKTGLDLRQWTKEDLLNKFGKSGAYYFDVARGIDHRPVRSQRVRKSLGKETTFSTDITVISELIKQLEILAERVFDNLEKHQLTGRTLTLKVKYANFELVTRAHIAENDLDLATIKSLLSTLLERTNAGQQAVRLVGLTISGFGLNKVEDLNSQLDLGLTQRI